MSHQIIVDVVRDQWKLIFSIGLLMWFWWQRTCRNFPPGPRGIPLLGVLPWMRNNTAACIKKWSEKYGSVMSVRFGMEDVVVLNNHDAVTQAFVKQAKIYSGRRQIPKLGLVKGLVTNDTQSFTPLKHFGLKFLKLNMGTTEIEKICNEEANSFVNHLKKKDGEMVSIGDELVKLTGNISTQVLFGKRFQYDNKELGKIAHMMGGMLTNDKDMTLVVLVRLWILLRNLPPFSGAVNQLRTRQAFLLEKVKSLIKEHRQEFNPDKVNTFLDAYIYEQTYGSQKEAFTDSMLEGFCFDMWSMGLEKGSSVITWCVFSFVRYPQFQEAIQQEVDQVLGNNGTPSSAIKKDMPLTMSFIQEVLRFKTMAPLGFEHVTTATSTLNGYTIPKGTTVLANLLGIHMDPEVWEEPTAFNPYRHMDANGSLKPSSKVIPFSMGSRSCLGESMVRSEIFVAFVKLVQTFEMSLGKTCQSNETLQNFVTCPQSFEVSFKERM